MLQTAVSIERVHVVAVTPHPASMLDELPLEPLPVDPDPPPLPPDDEAEPMPPSCELEVPVPEPEPPQARRPGRDVLGGACRARLREESGASLRRNDYGPSTPPTLIGVLGLLKRRLDLGHGTPWSSFIGTHRDHNSGKVSA